MPTKCEKSNIMSYVVLKNKSVHAYTSKIDKGKLFLKTISTNKLAIK